MKKTLLQNGQTLVELLLVIAMCAIILPVLLTGFITSREGKVQKNQRLEAVALLQEAQEATRIVRENGWPAFAINGTYHPELFPTLSPTTWQLVAGSEITPNGFTRTIDISDVYRDASGAIAGSGILDPSTKKIVITVSWGQPYNSSIDSTFYLTRHQENASYVETTQTQFNAGVKTGVTIRATNPPIVADDGEVILGAGGHSNWCAPSLASNSLDLPRNGVANAISAIEGAAFAATGNNASGISFAKVNIGTSPPYPPNATLADTFDGFKTNDIFGDTSYGYLATDNNAKEVVIINLSVVVNGKYQEAGAFDAPGNGSAQAVFVSGNYGYAVSGNKFYNFNKPGNNLATDVDGVILSGMGQRINIVGGYAYVAVSTGTNEMDIIDLSNPSNLIKTGSANIDANGGKDVYVRSDGNRAYLVAGQSATQREFFIIDTSVKNNPVLVPSGGTYDTSPMDPRGVALVPGNLAIVVGYGGEEYQVLNISTESSISKCTGIQVDSGINDVASILESDNDAYSYILVATDPEFRIIEGGPGGGYANSGTFESQTFSPGFLSANNRFTPNYSQPIDTEIKFQVSLASPIGGVCPPSGSYTFVGPGMSTSTYFTPASGSPITFPFGTFMSYSNPGQCFRYKAFFSTTNSNSTPVLYDVLINYSP